MQQVQAVIARAKGAPVEIATINVPDPGPGEAVVKVLRRAAEAELSERPVGKSVADNILAQHHGMRRQQALLRQQQVQLRLLEEEMQAALLRFRELKQTRG